MVLLSLGPGHPGLLSTALGVGGDAGGSPGSRGETLGVLVWAGVSAVESTLSRGLGVPILVVRAGSIGSCLSCGGSPELSIVPKDPLLFAECFSLPAVVAASTLVFSILVFIVLSSLGSCF